MLCPKCGAEIRDGLTFCPKCGKEFKEKSSHQNSNKQAENIMRQDEIVEKYADDNRTGNKKIYQKTWFIIVILIIFWPVGLFLMWKYASWNKIAKIIITVLIGLMVIYSFTGCSDNDSESANESTATVQEDTTTETAVKDTKTYQYGFKNNTIKTDNAKFKITGSKIITDEDTNTLILYYDYSFKGSESTHSSLGDAARYIVVSQGTYETDGDKRDNELGLGRNDEFIEWENNYSDPAEGKISHAESCWTLSDLTTPIKIAYNEAESGKVESHLFDINNNELVLRK